MIISINLTSLFVIIGLKINGIHYCKNIDHNITIDATNTINPSNIVSKQHFQLITTAYIICIIIMNLVCIHLFIIYLNLNSDSVPQNINQYQCNPDPHLVLKIVSGATVFLCYFAIHDLWNIRMISYHYNKHDCKKSKCLCLERTNSKLISKYQSTACCHSYVFVFIVLVAISYFGYIVGVSRLWETYQLGLVPLGLVIHCLFSFYEHWYYSDKKMVGHTCECCCNRPGFTVTQYIISVACACVISFFVFFELGDRGTNDSEWRDSMRSFIYVAGFVAGICLFLWILRPLSLMFGCIVSKYSLVSIYLGIVIPITYDTAVLDEGYTTGVIALSFFPFILGGFAICILLLLSSFEDFNKFTLITFAILLQFLDITTDINLIFEWIYNENNIFWATMQAIIILISQIVASMKMGNFDNIEQMDNYTLSMKKGISKFDRFMTLIGQVSNQFQLI